MLVSGLTEMQCRDFVGAGPWAEHGARWCAAEHLGAMTSGAEAAGQPVLWLYRAPWAMLDASSTEPAIGSKQALARWLEQNRAVLNMRRRLGDRLLLVNADRVSPQALRARLAKADTPTDAPAPIPQAGVLGQLFELSAPRYWDVYEALEAVSWLSAGEPQFRGGNTVDEDQLYSLLDLLDQHSRTKANLAQLQDVNEKQANDERELRRENQELKQEGELLLVQLHQVQEELEQYYLRNIDLEKAATSGKKTLAGAQNEIKALKIQLRQLQDELRRLQALTAPGPATATPSTTVAVNGTRPAPHALVRWIPGPARKVLGRPRTRRLLQEQIDLIRNSDWFDSQWYLDKYPDVRAAGIDPVEHYVTTGWKENRNPGAGFDTAYYLRCNPDISENGLNPLWHFIRFGRREGRLPRKV